MTKFKYTSYKRFYDKTRTHSLYSHRVWLPSYFPNCLTVTLASYYGVSQWAPFAEGAPDWMIILAVLVTMWLIATTLLTLFFLGCGVFDKEARAWGLFHLFNEKPVPVGFNPDYVNEPEYQSVLKEHFAGKDIGDLTKLNKLIAEKIELTGTINAPKSDIVKLETEALETYVEALRGIKNDSSNA